MFAYSLIFVFSSFVHAFLNYVAFGVYYFRFWYAKYLIVSKD